MRISDWSSDVCSSDLLGPLVEEERAVGIALAILQDRVPASFSEVAPARDRLVLADLPTASLTERRRLERSEEHTSELQSLMRISYAVFCLKKKKNNTNYS